MACQAPYGRWRAGNTPNHDEDGGRGTPYHDEDGVRGTPYQGLGIGRE